MMSADRVSPARLTRPLIPPHVDGAIPVDVSSTPVGRAPALLAYISAGIFASASGALNVVYGWNKGTDLPSSLTWAAVAAAVAIIFSLSWPALIRSLEACRWFAAVMTLAALLLSGAYSVTAALGSAAGGRADAATMETATTAARKRAQAAYEAAHAELAKIAATRPIGELEALLAVAKPQCRIVVANGYRDTVCAPPANLTAELARAKRRAELEVASAQAADQLAATRPAKQANSDAVAMSRYLAALGADIGPDRLNDLLVLLTVLLVECGAGLSLCIAQAAQSQPAVSREPSDQSDQPKATTLTARPNTPTEQLAVGRCTSGRTCWCGWPSKAATLTRAGAVWPCISAAGRPHCTMSCVGWLRRAALQWRWGRRGQR